MMNSYLSDTINSWHRSRVWLGTKDFGVKELSFRKKLLLLKSRMLGWALKKALRRSEAITVAFGFLLKF